MTNFSFKLHKSIFNIFLPTLFVSKRTYGYRSYYLMGLCTKYAILNNCSLNTVKNMYNIIITIVFSFLEPGSDDNDIISNQYLCNELFTSCNSWVIYQDIFDTFKTEINATFLFAYVTVRHLLNSKTSVF